MTWSGDEPSKPDGKTVRTPPTSRSSTWTSRPSTVASLEPFFQLVVKSESSVGPSLSSDLAGLGPRERTPGTIRARVMIPPATAKTLSRRPRRLTSMPPRPVMAALNASRSGSVEWNSWRSSTKGPWGMRYLPQQMVPMPRPSMPTASVPASHCVGGVDPVGPDEGDEPDHADDHGQHGQHLHPLRVLGRRLQVRVVEGGRGQRLVEAGLVVAHERSPIQKQTSIRSPTPMRSPTKPSPTGPMPPRPKPPALFGCWSTPVT